MSSGLSMKFIKSWERVSTNIVTKKGYNCNWRKIISLSRENYRSILVIMVK